MNHRLGSAIICVLLTCAILCLAYMSYGFYTMLLISGGFVLGLMLWLIFPGEIEYQRIRWPFWATMLAFLVLHKTEEAVLKFTEKLSKITGVEAPEPTSAALIALAVISILSWLLIPTLVPRRILVGNFLAWSFFASMGITELAHFVLPLFKAGSYGLFPGMASVVVLAPLAWWGLYCCFQSSARH